MTCSPVKTTDFHPRGLACMRQAAVMSRLRRHRAIWTLLFLSLMHFYGFSLEFDESENRESQRLNAAREFSIYDFEPRGTSLDSRDVNIDGWPDYWEAIRGENTPAWNADATHIVEDTKRPGIYRGAVGHVLQMPFDGTHVAMQTRIPKRVDPGLAYEITAWVRTENLNNSIVRINVIWLHVDEIRGMRELDREVLEIPRGQVDWPESPLQLRINELPSETNAVRILCEILDDPAFSGADRHGKAWFDDIKIESRPKIQIDPVFQSILSSRLPYHKYPPLPLTIQYRGLLPDKAVSTANGKSSPIYYRTLEILDIYGQTPENRDGVTVLPQNKNMASISPGMQRDFTEVLEIPFDKLGVYYVTVKLFSETGLRLAVVTQAVGLWEKPTQVKEEDIVTTAMHGHFSILLSEIPESIVSHEGLLSSIVEQTGLVYLKSHLWPENRTLKSASLFLENLNRELREIRYSGVRITGIIDNSPYPFRAMQMYQIMYTRAQELQPYLKVIGEQISPHIVDWQWGADNDPSFTAGINPTWVTQARKDLSAMTSAPVQGFPVHMGKHPESLPSPDVAQAASLFIPYTYSPISMASSLVPLTPDLFKRLLDPSLHLYPAASLEQMAPRRTAKDEIPEATISKKQEPVQPWLSLELFPVPRYRRDLIQERQQLADLCQKAIVAKALQYPRINLGSLFSPQGGLMAMTKDGEPVPRPSLLAVRTLDKTLQGCEYLGSFQLKNQHGDFPNFVFQHRNKKEVVIAVWYDGEGNSAPLDLGGGYHLRLVDMAGNEAPLKSDEIIDVSHVPVLVRGMRVPLARTRMSLRIDPVPPLQMRFTNQRQRLSVTNFYEQTLPGIVELEYATDNNFNRERNWTLSPKRMEFNLRASSHRELVTDGVEFLVRPTDNSTVDPGDSFGRKYVRIIARFNAEEPVTLRIIRETRLTTDLDVDVKKLKFLRTGLYTHLQMQIRWYPTGSDAKQREIVLTPFYKKENQLENEMPRIVIPAQAPSDPTPPKAIEIRIPRSRTLIPTSVGLRQDGGDRFYVQDVTRFMDTLTVARTGEARE